MAARALRPLAVNADRSGAGNGDARNRLAHVSEPRLQQRVRAHLGAQGSKARPLTKEKTMKEAHSVDARSSTPTTSASREPCQQPSNGRAVSDSASGAWPAAGFGLFGTLNELEELLVGLVEEVGDRRGDGHADGEPQVPQPVLEFGEELGR
jgi:hypothetical protein